MMSNIKIQDDKVSTFDIEYTGFCIIRDMLKRKLSVNKMVEGTRADFAVRPFAIDDDFWLPIQLKVTQCPSGSQSSYYRFAGVGKYTGMVIVCFCISNMKTWVLSGNVLNNIQGLQIGNNSNYAKYEVQFDKLHDVLETIYTSSEYNLHNLKDINIPVSEQQRREQEYRKLREQSLNNILFEYPERDGLCYDFKVNNYRVQEKVATIQKKNKKSKENKYIVLLSGNKPYKKHDNQFYWINIPDKEHFYIIPEADLIDGGFISNDGQPPLHTCLPCYPYLAFSTSYRHIWINKYLFRYSLVDQTLIEKIFSTGVVPQNDINIKDYSKPDNYIEICRDRMAKAKGHVVILFQNDIVKHEFRSVHEAARHMNVPRSTLRKSIKEKRECNGFFPVLKDN